MSRIFFVTCAAVMTVLAFAACGGNETTGTGGSGATGGGGGGGGNEESAADKLYRYLDGHFDSTQQAAADSAYFEINLQTCPLPLPDLGARVLHVEQAVINNGVIGQPYRQRVYVIVDGADPKTQAVSQVWEFMTASPNAFTGFCAGNGAAATTADIEEKTGCRVELTWVTDHFEGSTPGKECPSMLMGATYATSEVKVFEDRIESWDRGYDAMDKQVWGATKGPYVFNRLSPLPPPQK